MEFCLKQIVTGDSEPIIIRLQQDRQEIGRQSFPYLRTYHGVSGRHALLKKINNDWFVKDLGSLNGVYVNRREISERKKLQNGDIIGFGSQNLNGFVCTFCLNLPEIQTTLEVLSDNEPSEGRIDVQTNSTIAEISASLSENNSIENFEMSPSLNLSIPTEKNYFYIDNPPNLKDRATYSESKTLINNNSFNHSTDKLCNSSSASQNLKYIESQNHLTLQNVIKIPPMKLLSIPLVKCDSKYFNYPSDVKLPSQLKKKIHQRQKIIIKSSDEEIDIRKIKKRKTFKKRIYVESSDEVTDTQKRKKKKTRKYKRIYIESSDEDVNTQNKAFPPVLKRTNCDFELKSQSMCHNSSNHLLSDSDTRVSVDIVPETISTSHNNPLMESNTTVVETTNFSDSNDIFSINSVSEMFIINSNTSQKSSNVAIVKPMLSETWNICDKNKTGEGIGYSQEEEVIYISDTDTYLNFDYSQPIKQEPHNDDEESDLQLFNELPDENDVICEQDTNIYDESETGIQKFIQEHGISNIKTEPPEFSDEEVLNDAESLNISVQPVDMQATSKDLSILDDAESDGSDISLHSIIMIPTVYKINCTDDTSIKGENVTHSIRTNKSDVQKNSSLHRSVSKALLTESKPMKHCSRKIRGREELFEHNEPLLESKNNLKLETSKKVTQISERKEKLQSLSSKKSSVQLKSKKSAPTVKRRPEKFNSRSQFLINMAEEELSKKSNAKNKSSQIDRNKNKTLLPRTNSNSSLSLKQNEDVHSKPSTSKDIQVAVCISNEQTNKTTHPNNNASVSSYLPHPKMSQQKAETYASSFAQVSRTIDSSLNINVFDLSKLSRDNNFSLGNENFCCMPSTSKGVQVSVSCLRQGVNKTVNQNNNLSIDSYSSTNPSLEISQQNILTQFNSSNLQKSKTSLNHLNNNLYNSNQANVTKPLAIVSSTKRNESQALDNVKISFSTMLTKILYLNIKWIEEQKNMKVPPPDVRGGATNLPLKFSSFEIYVSHFTPMIMLDIWDKICKVAQPILEHKNQPKFSFSVRSYEIKLGLMECKCEYMIIKNYPVPVEGTLLIIDLKTEGPKNIIYPVFGYISKHRVIGGLIGRTDISSVWKHPSSQFRLDSTKLLEFSLVIKIKDQSPVLENLMHGKIICSIKHKLILADALKNLQFSPICKYILQPDKVLSINYQHIPNNRDFTSQKTVIEGISAEVLNPSNDPKIILLQGPPGTGKTTAIVKILQNLIDENLNNLKKTGKILMLAPSNIAVDNIGRLLLEINERSSWKKTPIKFVRIGLSHNIDVEIKKFTLDIQAKSEYKKFVMQELEKKEGEILKVTSELKMLPCYEKVKYKESLIKQCKEFKEQMLTENATYTAPDSIKKDILKESHIILSTLGSCNQSTLLSLFHSKVIRFSCCIIDEATQCTEPEILHPLTAFSINKLVLVGDPMQLPATIGSQFALERHYDRSMFERFYLYFTSLETPNPIYKFTEQFRMHPEICSFPFRNFYDCKLITVPNDNTVLFPLSPYVVYDILDDHESGCMLLNANCTKVIINMCYKLQQVVSSASVGIITPYEAQVKLYRYALSQYPDLEINTVDNFQGREKDIIIISCVHSNGSNNDRDFLSCKKTLNVALTRGRKSLFICVHANTLQYCKYWKDLINDAKQRKLLEVILTPEDSLPIFNKTMIKKGYC